MSTGPSPNGSAGRSAAAAARALLCLLRRSSTAGSMRSIALSENGGAAKLRALGVAEVDVVPLGVELGQFSPDKRDPRLRRKLGLADGQPLLDLCRPAGCGEAAARRRRSISPAAAVAWRGAAAARRRTAARTVRRPREASASSRLAIAATASDLAAWLASADLYVSAMADETFGISIIEAQASGLPVVGVAAGRWSTGCRTGLDWSARSTMPRSWRRISWPC